MEDFERRRKMKLRKFILIDIVIIIIIGVIFFDKDNKVVNDIKNYATTTFASITNTNKKQSDNNVENVILEKSEIEVTNGISKLTTKITNDSTEKNNFRFKVKFIAADGSTTAELSVYVGVLKAKEIKYMVSYITADVSKVKNIVYEIL